MIEQFSSRHESVSHSFCCCMCVSECGCYSVCVLGGTGVSALSQDPRTFPNGRDRAHDKTRPSAVIYRPPSLAQSAQPTSKSARQRGQGERSAPRARVGEVRQMRGGGKECGALVWSEWSKKKQWRRNKEVMESRDFDGRKKDGNRGRMEAREDAGGGGGSE